MTGYENEFEFQNSNRRTSDLDIVGFGEYEYENVSDILAAHMMPGVPMLPAVPNVSTFTDIRERTTSSESNTSDIPQIRDIRVRTISEESRKTPDQVSSPGSSAWSMSPAAPTEYVTLQAMSPASTVTDMTYYVEPVCNGQTPVFLTKLWTMVEQNLPVAKWGNGEGTIIINQKETNCLYHYFKTNKITSFIRQLNMYGFNKISTDGDLLCFRNEYFVQGQPGLMQKIKRNSSSAKRPTDPSAKRTNKKSTNAGLSDRLDKVENNLDQMRSQFGKMMSEVVHVIMAARPGDYPAPMAEICDNRKRPSTTPYPMITSARTQKDPGNLIKYLK